jgi:hypothetical protein
MEHQSEGRRDRITLLAIEPKDRTLTCHVQISFERMQAVARRSIGHAKECGHIVPAILERPTAIFEGLRKDEDVLSRGCYDPHVRE